MLRTALIALATIAATTGSTLAENGTFRFGGDVYTSGNQATISQPVENDVFAAGFNASVDATVKGDAHLAGFSVSVTGPVNGNVYAAGNSIVISGRIGADVNAAGSSVTLSGSTPIMGNARLVGANIDISKPIEGSLTSASASTTLNSAVAGDFFFAGETLSFGPNARVAGQVEITSSSDIAVPASVAPADRVTIKKVSQKELEKTGQQEPFAAPFWPGTSPLHGLFTALILTIVGGLWVVLAPRRSENSYIAARSRPLKALWFGILALAALFGLLPVAAISIIGLPLLPFVVLALIVMTILGYAAGGWYLGRQALTALSFMPAGRGGQVLAMAFGIVILLVLGIIPFAGWIVQFFAIMFGLGGMALAALTKNPSPHTDASNGQPLAA